MRKLLIPLVFVTLLTSCATHNGMISSSSLNKPVVYEDIAYGVSQTNMILGFGGLSKDALILEAKKELINNRPLKENETYANFTVDFKRSFFPFYNSTKATMSADVVRFSADSQTAIYSDLYKHKLTSKSLANTLFAIGDSVYVDGKKKVVIISIEGIDRVRVLFKTDGGNSKTKIIKTHKIYTKNKAYKGYKVGEMYIYSRELKGREVKTSARIIAFGLNKLMAKDGNDKLIYFDYKN